MNGKNSVGSGEHTLEDLSLRDIVNQISELKEIVEKNKNIVNVKDVDTQTYKDVKDMSTNTAYLPQKR